MLADIKLIEIQNHMQNAHSSWKNIENMPHNTITWKWPSQSNDAFEDIYLVLVCIKNVERKFNLHMTNTNQPDCTG